MYDDVFASYHSNTEIVGLALLYTRTFEIKDSANGKQGGAAQVLYRSSPGDDAIRLSPERVSP